MYLFDNRKIVTIITVVYNNIRIEETIKSVIPFLTNAVEYIIIDGGSKDGTELLLKKYESYLAYSVSEKDFGIYDAMNKGVSKANGHYILHLNSGDILVALPLERLINAAYNQVDILSFPVSINAGEMIYKPLFDWRVKFRTSLHHQGTFYRKELVSYNTSYKIFSDFNLNQNLYIEHRKVICCVNPIVAIHMEDGISAKSKGRRKECLRVIKNNFGITYCVAFYIYMIMKVILKRRY